MGLLPIIWRSCPVRRALRPVHGRPYRSSLSISQGTMQSWAVRCSRAYYSQQKFCWTIIMAGLWETAGFAVRSYSATEFRGLGHFIPQQLLIILAPLWTNAFVYMVAGRMIHFLIPEKKVVGIGARRLTLIFVLCDILSFLIQGSSSSLMSSDNHSTVKIGIKICMPPCPPCRSCLNKLSIYSY